jgi:hypothetical protein
VSTFEQAPHLSFEGRARQQHPPPACLAADANIGTYAHHLPAVAAAGVLFAHLDNIIDGDGE